MRLQFSSEVFRLGISIALLLFATSHCAGEDLPTIEAVKTRMEQTLTLIKNLQVEEATLKRQRDFNGRDEIYEMDRETKWTVTSDGKRHYVSTGGSLSFNNQGATIVPYKTELAFDGEIARSIKYLSRDLAKPFSGAVADHPSSHTMNPLKMTPFWERETLLDIISGRPFHVVEQEAIYGREALVILGDPIDRDDWQWNYKIHFDMERGTQLKVAYVMRRPGEEEWIEYAQWAALDHTEVIPGVWLPRKYRYFSFSVKDDGSPVEFFGGLVGTFRQWKVNQQLPADRFTLTFPENLPVNDQRKGENGRLLGKNEIAILNDSASR